MFSAVVEEAGFSRAAERLNVSQSAVSQAIANLEHKLDTQLLIRKQQPELTEAGARLFTFAQTVIYEEHNALEDIQQIRSGALSTLNLAMNSVVNQFFGKDLLLEFCERNPLTRLQLAVAPSRELVIGVDEGRWELGIGPFQRGMPGHFELVPFFSEVRTLVAHDNHPHLSELRTYPEQALRKVTLLTSYVDDVARRPGNERMRNAFGSVWEVGHLDLRLALAQAGKGVTYLSDRLLTTLDHYHPIVGLDISTIDRDVGLYYKRHRPLSEGAKRFVAICKTNFPQLTSGSPARTHTPDTE